VSSARRVLLRHGATGSDCGGRHGRCLPLPPHLDVRRPQWSSFAIVDGWRCQAMCVCLHSGLESIPFTQAADIT